MARLFLAALLSLFASASTAQDAGSLALVKRGGDAYVSSGADAALTVWLSGSALEGNPQATSQANLLRQIEAFYGKPESMDVVKQSSTSPRSEIIYFTINYAKGIAYGRFQTYRTKSGQWVATAFKFNTDAIEIFPSSLLTTN